MTGMRIVTRILTTATLLAAVSCGSAVRTGSSPVFLVIDTLSSKRGGSSSGQDSTVLSSDVLTIITTGGTCTTSNPCATIFPDGGSATLRLSPKNIGTTTAPNTPSQNNEVLITRIHISYRRTDGRNVEGVDVPFSFDTAATGTVPATGTLTLGFELVRSQAKTDAPLMALESNGVVISTIADVTFFGQDRTGNAISATGSIAVNFANFGD
jgi:hypothetical protein